MESPYLTCDNEAARHQPKVVVHKMRNPLTSIKLSLALVAAKTGKHDFQKHLDYCRELGQERDDAQGIA